MDISEQVVVSRAMKHAARTSTQPAVVRFEKVALAYDETSGNAIEDISLSIAAGEFVAIVGPSGCGKSTFMKLCSGLKFATGGTVVVEDQRVTGPLKIVGMAFQAPNLLPWRTALQNVMLPLEIVEPYRSSFKTRRAEYTQRALKLLRAVGLEGYEHKYPWQLSGGMQQRTSICRALVHEPKLLMLDEPFAALDAFTREEMWCMLRDIWREQAVTIVLVTHDLREAVFLADTVYCMSKRPGRIVALKRVELPRPRELDLTYSERFSELVHELRTQIGRERKNVEAVA